jgi:hypothetical protein
MITRVGPVSTRCHDPAVVATSARGSTPGSRDASAAVPFSRRFPFLRRLLRASHRPSRWLRRAGSRLAPELSSVIRSNAAIGRHARRRRAGIAFSPLSTIKRKVSDPPTGESGWWHRCRDWSASGPTRGGCGRGARRSLDGRPVHGSVHEPQSSDATDAPDPASGAEQSNAVFSRWVNSPPHNPSGRGFDSHPPHIVMSRDTVHRCLATSFTVGSGVGSPGWGRGSVRGAVLRPW